MTLRSIELNARLHELLPDLKIRYFFRPRPLCYHVLEPIDTWKSVSQKAYGTELFAMTIYFVKVAVRSLYLVVPAKSPQALRGNDLE
jgi:hypothetical protein